jgi:hypothetical protein
VLRKVSQQLSQKPVVQFKYTDTSRKRESIPNSTQSIRISAAPQMRWWGAGGGRVGGANATQRTHGEETTALAQIYSKYMAKYE